MVPDNGSDAKIANILAQLKNLLDNETNIDDYLMKMELLFNELNSAGAIEENEPFMHKVADKLTELMNAEEVA